MIVLAVVWQAQPGHESEVADLFRKLTAESRREAGCLMYQVHRQKDDPRRFFIYEQYKDEAALEAHRNTPHFLQYARKQLAPIAERLEGNLYQPL
jgi:quinol monooxygenase YgiN